MVSFGFQPDGDNPVLNRDRVTEQTETNAADSSMRVSVVVPTYNSGGRLKATIESVLAQTVAPREIIIIDDGSTDDTPGICAAFGDAVRYIPIANGGQQRARNLGVELATGDWISLLDHDDLWHPEYLAELAAFQRNNTADLIISNSRTVREQGAEPVVGNRNRFIESAPSGYWQSMGIEPGGRWDVLDRYGYAQYLRFHPAQPSVITVRKDLFQRLGGYDERMRGSSAENFEFELRALRVARVGLLWRPLVTITRHAKNASVDGSKMAMDVVGCLKFVLNHRGLTDLERSAIEAELQTRLPDAIDGAFTLRRFRELRDYHSSLAYRLGAKMRIKCGVAWLPGPVANLCAGVLAR